METRLRLTDLSRDELALLGPVAMNALTKVSREMRKMAMRSFYGGVRIPVDHTTGDAEMEAMCRHLSLCTAEGFEPKRLTIDATRKNRVSNLQPLGDMQSLTALKCSDMTSVTSLAPLSAIGHCSADQWPAS